ncbi:hypothetical protein Tco_1476497 [Tanacetum coccineum]
MNVEESSSKSMLAIDGVGFDWSFMTEEKTPTNFALMAFSYSKVNKSVYENSSNEIKKTSGAIIIEDWISDCDEDETLEKVSESSNVQKPKQADQPRKISQNPRNNRTNWNTPMSKKLGVGFQFTLKACFVCGIFNHLIKDCDFHDNKMVQKPVLNNVKKGTGQREVRQVWNNAMNGLINQIYFILERNCDPTAVLTSLVACTKLVTAKQLFKRAGRQQISKIDWLLSSEVNVEGSYYVKCKSSMNERICYIKSMLKESKHLGISKEIGTLSRAGQWQHKLRPNPWQHLMIKVLWDLVQSNDPPLLGGYTPGCDEGRKKLNELTKLCTKLSKKVTSFEQDLKQTKQVYGKALTKLVNKVKHLEDQLKSTTKRIKAKVVISHEEEDLVSEDPSKQGRMLKTKYGDVETKHAEEKSFEVHLDVLQRLSKATPEEEPTEDMEKALWVGLKRLFEPDKVDVLWKLQNISIVNCSYGFNARLKVASRRR